MDRGIAIVQQAFDLLSTNLATALKNGGISNALPYCSVAAAPLTKMTGDIRQVTLKRVTHKPRNLTNRASKQELAVIRRFQNALDQGTTPASVLVTNELNKVTFLAPIVIQNELCLQCHGRPGQELKSETLNLVRSLYPKDEATGFKIGDLRGMWRVDFP